MKGAKGFRLGTGVAVATLLTIILLAEVGTTPVVAEEGAREAVVTLKPVVGGALTVSSSALTQQAWAALEQRRYDLVLAAADECLRRFGSRAARQQALLSDFAPKEAALKYWALNDVATCLFIKGTALKEQKKKGDAKNVFRGIIEQFPYAQCWDPRGWFWKVAQAARGQIFASPKG